MKSVRTSRKWQCAGLILGLASFWLLATASDHGEAAAPADPPGKQESRPAKPRDKPSEKLRSIRIAVFDVEIDARRGDDGEGPAAIDHVSGPAVTDQLNTILAALPQVTLVNRDQIKRVAEEHQIALSGLVETPSAVKLGKFLSAQYIVAGRASRIGQTLYLVLKIVDVETTEQTTVSAKAPAESGFQSVLDRLGEPLAADIRRLQRPVAESADAALAELRKLAQPLSGKVLLLSVEETHVGRPLGDPAAEMAIVQRLRSLGLSVIVPKDPGDGWKESLLQTGRYGDKKVDYLLEGEGTSAFAAQMQGLMSCRARVELRLIPVPGRAIAASDRGVAAGVDLVESLAAKTALEEAGVQACDALVRRAAGETRKK
jgi:TolB-like protein